MTPHPVAAALALGAGGPLTASSANLNGRQPVCRVEQLDPELLAALEHQGQMPCVLTLSPSPQGGEPSTLVEPLADGENTGPRSRRLRMVRAGAVSAQALEAAGFTVV